MLEHPVLLTTLNSKLIDSQKGKLSWSSLLFKSFGKIQDKGQSAGNILNKNGSSETTRETYINDISIPNNVGFIYKDEFKL
jgi:hypothetical protein